MEKSFSESYRRAGVDITAGYRAVELMKKHVRATFIPGVCEDIGGFGGLFMPDLSGIRRRGGVHALRPRDLGFQQRPVMDHRPFNGFLIHLLSSLT